MSDRRTLVVIGGTAGIGRKIAQRAVVRGDTVIIAGRDAERAAGVAKELGGDLPGPFRVPAGEHHLPAAFGVERGDLAADSLGAADHHDASGIRHR